MDQLIKAGLVREVEFLLEKGLTEDSISMKGIGYKESFHIFTGNMTSKKQSVWSNEIRALRETAVDLAQALPRICNVQFNGIRNGRKGVVRNF